MRNILALDPSGNGPFHGLCRILASHADELDLRPSWPAAQLRACGECGVFRWFLPAEWGGLGWSEREILQGYLGLAESCLTTSFIITQRAAACRRIAASGNEELKQRLLPGLAGGAIFATVAISHLSTSRRHLGRPALAAQADGDNFVLDGYSAWVTGARHADTIVTGAVLDDGRQLLAALPAGTPGVEPREPARLLALSASHTGELHCRRVRIGPELLLAGPDEHVLGQAGGAGGLQTSALAIGLARAAIKYLSAEAARRGNLAEAALGLAAEADQLQDALLAASFPASVPARSADQIRARANSLVLRATQAALAAAKGAGFALGHPAGRWCREALFFLVWSCPQGVLDANLCELAGLE